MREALHAVTLALFFFVCTVADVGAQPDGDQPFKLRAQSDDREPFDLVKLVGPEGPTKREWRKIMTNVKAELRDLER